MFVNPESSGATCQRVEERRIEFWMHNDLIKAYGNTENSPRFLYVASFLQTIIAATSPRTRTDSASRTSTKRIPARDKPSAKSSILTWLDPAVMSLRFIATLSICAEYSRSMKCTKFTRVEVPSDRLTSLVSDEWQRQAWVMNNVSETRHQRRGGQVTRKHAVMRNMPVHFYRRKGIPGRHHSSAAVKGTTAEWHRVTSLDLPRLYPSFSTRENESESESKERMNESWD